MKKIKLGDVLDVKRGASLSGEYYAEEGTLIRLTLGNFNYPNGGFKKNTSKADIFFTGPVKEEFILKKGDIITPLTEQVSGLLGETATIPEDDLYVQCGDVGLIIPDETKISKRFAYYLVSSPAVKKQLGAGAQQTKIRHTSPDAIKACEAWIPEELSDQDRIAGFFDDINEEISNNASICSDLEAMAKLLYDYWFVQFDFPDENGKPYKSSGGKMIWNEELKREIPEGWKSVMVSEITKRVKVGFVGTVEKHYCSRNEGFPIVRPAEMSVDGIDYSSLENRIRFDDWPKIKELNMSVIGAENPYDAFKRLSSGDVCLYGKTEGDSYFRPIQWVDDAKYYFGNIVKKPVKVQNTTYYQSYYVETDSDGAITVQFSHNLLLETANHKFKFDLKSRLPELYNDACFLLALLSANEYYVGDACIKYSRFELDSSFKERLHLIIDICDTLKMIDLEIDNPFVQKDKTNINQLINLINVRFSTPKAKEGIQYTRYNWMYGDKFYPVIIQDDGKSIELFSALYSDKLGVFVEYQETEDRKRLCKLPLFLFVDSNILANLYCYKYDLFLNQIRECEINEATYAPLLDRSILLINVFDVNGDSRFLDLANEVFVSLSEFEPHDFLEINKLQIRQRINGLCEADIDQLMKIESENPYTMFGKHILLGNKQLADYYFSQIPSHDQEKYREYPIYTLYSKLH